MKKSDIEFHRSGIAGPAVPAVNVKCSLFSGDFTDDKIRPPATDVLGDRVDEFIAWWHEQDNVVVKPGGYPETALDRLVNSAWEFACQSGWELLQDRAKEIWPDRDVKVFSEGRSGGWAIIDGLYDVEAWDAIMVSKWSRFAKECRDIVNDIPYQMVWGIAANVFEPVLEERDKAADDDTAAQLPVNLSTGDDE